MLDMNRTILRENQNVLPVFLEKTILHGSGPLHTTASLQIVTMAGNAKGLTQEKRGFVEMVAGHLSYIHVLECRQSENVPHH